MWEKDFSKIEEKISICVNEFFYENKLVFPIYVSDQTFENSLDLLLVIDENKPHYVYIKDFLTDLYSTKQRIEKKNFCKTYLQCFSSKNVLTEHKEVCLSINGVQSVKSEKEAIEFKTYFKQISVPFKVYADLSLRWFKFKVLTQKISRWHSLQFCLQTCLCWW